MNTQTISDSPVGASKGQRRRGGLRACRNVLLWSAQVLAVLLILCVPAHALQPDEPGWRDGLYRPLAHPASPLDVGPPIQITTSSADDVGPSLTQAADGTLWMAWTSSRSGNNDVWYKTSGDVGSTWSDATAITTHSGLDTSSDVVQTSDGKIWAVWHSYRLGNSDIWYKTSSDGGDLRVHL